MKALLHRLFGHGDNWQVYDVTISLSRYKPILHPVLWVETRCTCGASRGRGQSGWLRKIEEELAMQELEKDLGVQH